MGRFIKDKGVRQAGNSLQGGFPFPFFDGQEALKKEFTGGQAAGGKRSHGGGGTRHGGKGNAVFVTECDQSLAGIADTGHARIGDDGAAFAVH